MISNIHSKYSFQELFSFISEKRKLKIIKKNKYLNKKLDISIIDYKKYFFQKKIEYYGYYRIKDYYEELKNYLNNIILNEEELNDLLSYCLSKNEYFNLSLSDEQFDFIFKNSYFEQNMRIDIDYLNEEYIPKNILIKDNTLTNKFVKVLKECFSLYSNNERMNKFQASRFISKVIKKEIYENDKVVNHFFQIMILIMMDYYHLRIFSNFILIQLKRKKLILFGIIYIL
jgi:hypothetical protein